MAASVSDAGPGLGQGPIEADSTVRSTAARRARPKPVWRCSYHRAASSSSADASGAKLTRWLTRPVRRPVFDERSPSPHRGLLRKASAGPATQVPGPRGSELWRGRQGRVHPGWPATRPPHRRDLLQAARALLEEGSQPGWSRLQVTRRAFFHTSAPRARPAVYLRAQYS